MEIDTSLLDVFDYRIGSLYQWIGDVAACSPPTSSAQAVKVRARILRAMDDLDVDLYHRALAVRRKATGEWPLQ
ncbi:hypothetical protein BC831DRAFT_448973 [Entophlyctis helioformis]|nr:hypothetical protein BC831DRAFT_448973 [Entophlyctis helioformis]